MAMSTLGRGTDGYRSPELMQGNPNYSTKSHIWALGCILYELCMKIKVFAGMWEIWAWNSSSSKEIKFRQYENPDVTCKRCASLFKEVGIQQKSMDEINEAVRT